MDERQRLVTDLRDLGAQLDASVDDRDLHQTVVTQLRTMQTSSRRPVLWVAVAVAAVLSATTLAVPAARAAIADLFGFRAEHIRNGPPPVNASVDDTLRIGPAVSLDAARQRQRVLVPTATPYLDPSEVHYRDVGGGQVTLVYRPTAALPATSTPGVGMLIMELRGSSDEIITKYLASPDQAQPVDIGGTTGVVIAGDHFIFYVDPSGRAVDEPGRISGNALVFQRGGLTVRIEANLPMEQLAAVARSMS